MSQDSVVLGCYSDGLLGGNRRWAKLAYVMAVPYLLIIPVGTLVGYVILSGLSGYLESKEKISIAGKESNRL